MGFIRIYEGSIENVLHSGEYDSGDGVLIDYDELADLVEQGNMFKRIWLREILSRYVGDSIEGHEAEASGLSYIERRTNRPIHPVLGGKSPYSEFLGV